MNSLWKTLKKLPLPKQFHRKKPTLRFLDLPEDIVYEILHHLDTPSICNLSLTCNRLYLPLLTFHLRRHTIKDPFTEIHLHGDNSSAAIPALRLLLYHNPIKAFTWRAGKHPKTLVREVEQLRRLIARVSIIEYLELDFSNDWPVHEFQYGYENGYWAWIRLVTNLLHVIAQRCHFVVITNHYQVLVPWVTFIGGVPYNLDPPLLERICTEWQQGSKSSRLVKSASKISLAHPDIGPGVTKAAFPPPFPPEKTNTVYSTKRLIVNDPGLFQRSIFGEWAMDWVNNMPLTHLVIHQGRMRIPLLRHMRLPHLVSLTISHGYGLSTSDVILVLQNNKSLSAVDFLDTKLDTSSAIIVVKKRKHFQPAMHIGLSVERFKGTPSFLRGMLDLELAFPHLNTVVVQVKGDGRSEQSQLHQLYGSLAEGRVNLSKLVFEFPSPYGKRSPSNLEDWLLAAMGDQDLRDEMKEAMAGLQNVRIVHLHYLGIAKYPNLCSDLSAAPIQDTVQRPPTLPDLLAAWVSMFPALCEITFTHIFDEGQRKLLGEFLRGVSPTILVRVDGAVLFQPRTEYLSAAGMGGTRRTLGLY